jgi:hypothetical protein
MLIIVSSLYADPVSAEDPAPVLGCSIWRLRFVLRIVVFKEGVRFLEIPVSSVVFHGDAVANNDILFSLILKKSVDIYFFGFVAGE